MVRPSPEPTSSLYALIAHQLRFQRLKHKMTQTEIGQIIGCTKGQVSKYEVGLRQLDKAQCRTLDELWDTGGIFSTLLEFAKMGIDPNWRESLRKYQVQANTLRLFSNNIIPLPFQSEGYARTLLQAGFNAGLVTDLDGAVERRMKHQAEMLAGDPRIWAVLDVVALRSMGSPAVMAEQRDLLLEFAQQIPVSIRIVSAEAAPHIGIDGSFTCFELRNGLRAAFAGTNLDVGRVIDDQAEAASVAVRFEQIAARALSEDQSREWIAGMRT
nr:helix-turn-helix transcriptional regulator [Spirillospora albida]